MTAAQSRSELMDQLLTRYEESEAGNISRIVLEELFQTRLVPSLAPLSELQQEQLARWTQRLLEGEPLQYVVGNTHFYGLVFSTDARALIPRPETEELVRLILEAYSSERPLKVLDIGTGSGCIAVTLKKKRPQWEITGLDVSADALALAQENAAQHHCTIRWVQQDILDEALWPGLGKFDLIVSNPPYIPEKERVLMAEQVLKYEPATALFVSDEDPILFYRAIARLAWQALTSRGCLFMELNEFQADVVERLLLDLGYRNVALHKDLQGKFRMITAHSTGI